MEPNPIVEKRYNRRWKTKKPKNQMKKEKGGKELTWPNTIHQSVFYLHARNIRGRNSEPPWIPSVPTPFILPSFLLSFLSFHASPPPSLLLCPRKRNLVLDRDSCSSDAILVYRVWLGRETRLACPDVRQLKQADVHDIAQSVIRIGWLIAPGSLDGEI